uniref:Putative amastin n=1 Tax=Leishmania guyanensis TaxID=5670 RepID=A0A1E1J9H8_LEIGU|nr:Putative amastin [Leishmania guyanensis]
MFRFKGDTRVIPGECITLWDLKLNCMSVTYAMSANEQWAPCPPRRNRFRMGQAFAVISIFVYGMAFVLGVIMLFCHRRFRWVCLVLNIFGTITVFFVWVTLAVSFNENSDVGCPELKTPNTYGAGFVLFLLAWLLDIANIAVLLFLCQDSGSGESGNAIGNKGQEYKEENKGKQRTD